MPPLVHESGFDSELFGIRFGRIRATAQELAAANPRTLRDELAAFDYVDGRVPVEERAALSTLVRSGMAPVDGLILFDRPATPRVIATPANLQIRVAGPADLPALAPFASILARGSRFGRTPALGLDSGEKLYRRWIENSIAGTAAYAVLVAVQDSIIGFVTLQHAEPDADELVLVGVLPTGRGHGVADALVEAAAVHASREGRARLLVKTSLDNIAAQRSYQRCGFRTRSVYWVLEHAGAQSGPENS